MAQCERRAATTKAQVTTRALYQQQRPVRVDRPRTLDCLLNRSPRLLPMIKAGHHARSATPHAGNPKQTLDAGHCVTIYPLSLQFSASQFAALSSGSRIKLDSLRGCYQCTPAVGEKLPQQLVASRVQNILAHFSRELRVNSRTRTFLNNSNVKSSTPRIVSRSALSPTARALVKNTSDSCSAKTVALC